jgi:Protein of unknown function (DUF2971)
MIIFRYLASHSLETLKDARLKVVRISSFNDPFECMYRASGVMTRAKAREYFRAKLERREFLADLMHSQPQLASFKSARRFLKANLDRYADELVRNYDSIKEASPEEREAVMDHAFRVVCFSSSGARPLDEILLWSHYTDKHKGVRIGFEFPAELTKAFRISPITYQDERVAVDLTDDSQEASVKQALLLSTKVKSTAWAYEKEYRLMTVLSFCVVERGADNIPIEYLPIERGWVRRIDFGARCNRQARRSILDIAKKDYPHAECFQADYHKTDYALTYTKL